MSAVPATNSVFACIGRTCGIYMLDSPTFESVQTVILFSGVLKSRAGEDFSGVKGHLASRSDTVRASKQARNLCFP